MVFWVGGADKEVEPDSRQGDTARLAVRVDVATTVTCTAENSGTARPLVSSRVQINIRSEFLPTLALWTSNTKKTLSLKIKKPALHCTALL